MSASTEIISNEKYVSKIIYNKQVTVVVKKYSKVAQSFWGKGQAKMVSYDKQSVLEGTREFHLVTFIMLV